MTLRLSDLLLLMLNWAKELWLGSAPVEFESSFGVAESVELLRAATRRSVFSALGQQEAVGTVKESHVSLQRVIPLVGNSFKPFFRGHFIERDGKVILTGRFTMIWPVKVFMAFWFGGIGCFILLAIVMAPVSPQKAIVLPLSGLGMIAAGGALVAFGRWLSRNDVAWLSDAIRGALCEQVPVTDTFNQPSKLPDRPSKTTTIIAGVLVLIAVASWPAVIYGNHGVLAGHNGLGAAYVCATASRYLTAILCVAALLLAFGVYRRQLVAWRAGLVFLAAIWVNSVLRMLADYDMRSGAGGAIAFVIGTLFVAVFWMRWWYAQSIHFKQD